MKLKEDKRNLDFEQPKVMTIQQMEESPFGKMIRLNSLENKLNLLDTIIEDFKNKKVDERFKQENIYLLESIRRDVISFSNNRS